MRHGILMAFAAMAMIATPALAKDRSGYSAIAAGDFAKAERMLNAERRSFPNEPELMLNLASVYSHTGRAAEAQAMYRAVIAQPDVAMDLPNGATASSHTLAEAGLMRSRAPELSAR